MVKIRKMDMSDVPYVFNTEQEVFGKSIEESMLYDELIYNKMSQYFIALKDGKRLGYIGVWITEPNAEIVNIVVDKANRQQGTGKLLMHEAMQYCAKHDVDMVTLEVRKSNDAAIHLYESFGFKQEAIRKNYYNNGEDALLMVFKMGGQPQ